MQILPLHRLHVLSPFAHRLCARLPFTLTLARRYPTYTEAQTAQFLALATELLGDDAFLSDNGLERGKPFIVGVVEPLLEDWRLFKIYGSGASYAQALRAAERADEPTQHQAFCCECLHRQQYPAPYPWQEDVCPVCHNPILELLDREIARRIAESGEEDNDANLVS